MATMAQATTPPLLPGEIPARIAARVIDTLILTAIGVAFGQVIGFKYDWLVMTASFVLAYFVLADVLAGATPGKVVMRLRVIGGQGEKPSVKQAFQREWFMLLGAVPFAGPFLALAAWVWIVVAMRSSPMRQGVHDRWAGTRVVQR